MQKWFWGASNHSNDLVLSVSPESSKTFHFNSYRFSYILNSYLLSRESEGSFQIGGYWREADDLHAVIQHFQGAKRVIHAILGHSKGVPVYICSNIKMLAINIKKEKFSLHKLIILWELLEEDQSNRALSLGFQTVGCNTKYFLSHICCYSCNYNC